jgi:hypothetical protein
MIAFRLDDFKEQPLREAGMQLGIPDAATMAKEDLVREIRAKVSPNSAVVFVPMTASEVKPLGRLATILSIAAMLISLGTGAATWLGVIAALNKTAAEREEKLKESWQASKVYDILERGTSDKEKWGGLTFEEVKAKYSEEVTAEQDVRLGKDDLQPKVLKRILIGMIETGLVSRTIDDRYIIQRYGVNTKESVLQAANGPATSRLILRLLATEAGKYTVDKLGTKLATNFKTDAEEYYATINSLKVTGLIVIDSDDRVWSAVSPPKKR